MTRNCFAAAIAAVVWFSSTASAVRAATFSDTVTQTVGASPAQLELPQYQPQIGEQLRSVTLALSGNLQGQVQLQNPTSQSQLARISLASLFMLDGPESQPLFFSTLQTGATQQTPPMSVTESSLSVAESFAPLTLAAGQPYVDDHFIGDGQVRFSFLTADFSNVVGSRDITSSVVAQAAATLQVTYRTRQLSDPGDEPTAPGQPDRPGNTPVPVSEPSLALGLAILASRYLMLRKPATARFGNPPFRE
ncbi:MAG: choice-of-anchor E domain-containing protein [Leptolyngbya sp. SIO4C1]|nr:choice-of-anchor E domain-containing protein [Leptolyngbya sp. SIO4C1]